MAINIPRSTYIWLMALILSFTINILLFGFMPCLIENIPSRDEISPCIERINIVRIRRPEIPPKRSTKKKIKVDKPDRARRAKISGPKEIYRDVSLDKNLFIPFEINAKLPPVTGTIPVVSVDRIPIGIPNLDGIFDMGEIDRPLRPLVKIPPLYPFSAKRRGIEGWVKVRFIVNREGMVENIEVVESQPKGVFEDAVINAVSKWRFLPGTVAGEPVRTLAQITIRFRLKGK